MCSYDNAVSKSLKNDRTIASEEKENYNFTREGIKLAELKCSSLFHLGILKGIGGRAILRLRVAFLRYDAPKSC